MAIESKFQRTLCLLCIIIGTQGCEGAFSETQVEGGDSATTSDNVVVVNPAETDSAQSSVADTQRGRGTETGANTITGTVATSEDSETQTPLSQTRVIGKDCMAPDREEYMNRFGVTPADKDLTDPNVVAAKEHTILFIFDKSGSMGHPWNEDGGSKWEIARSTMIDAVSPFLQYVHAGAVFFSLSDGYREVALIDSGLQINYAAASDFLDMWDENMEMYGSGGGTPLMDSLEAANDAIALACEAGILSKPFKVVLLTDGMPDYWDSEQGLSLVKDWYGRGISTTVVGMPGSDTALQLLSDIASVGSGGTVSVDGKVDGGSAEAVMYTNTSTTDEFTGNMTLMVE